MLILRYGMKTALSSTINSQIRRVSKKLGIQEKELLKNAVLFYLDSIAPYLDLKGEFDAWEKLSDATFLKFEKSL